MPIQSAIAQVGAGKQSAKGTAGTADYTFGVTDGSILTLDVRQEAEERTSAYLASPGANRTGVVAGFNFTSRAHANSVGLLCTAALGTDTWASTIHTITAATSIPYLTMFGKQGSTVYSVQDCKVDSLEFSWDGNNPLSVAASGMGTTVANWGGATFTGGTDDTYATYMRPAGGFFAVSMPGSSIGLTNYARAGYDVTLTTSAAHSYGVGDSITVVGVGAQYDGIYVTKAGTTGSTVVYASNYTGTVSQTATTGTVAKNIAQSSAITTGSVSLARNLQEIMVSGTITPNDVFEGRLDVECSFDVVVDDWNMWRAIATGTASGTSASATPLYGAFYTTFTDGTNTITLAATRVAFTADVPSVDPAGGYQTLSLAGLALMPAAGGSPLTITLVGGKGSAY